MIIPHRANTQKKTLGKEGHVPVLTHRYSVSAPVEQVHDLLTDFSRLTSVTDVSKVRGESPEKITVGTTWKNRGTTMLMPAFDTTTVTEVTDHRIAWTTRSILLGIVPSRMHWSYHLEEDDRDTVVTNTLERVWMIGIPFGLVVRLPILPFLYLARGSMRSGGQKLVDTVRSLL